MYRSICFLDKNTQNKTKTYRLIDGIYQYMKLFSHILTLRLILLRFSKHVLLRQTVLTVLTGTSAGAWLQLANGIETKTQSATEISF